MWKKRIAAVSLMLAVSSPAAADWQYTKWGMTPDEVVAASGGAATYIPEKELQGIEADAPALLEAPYAAAGYEFRVRFRFSRTGNRLAEVNPRLTEPNDCIRLMGALVNRYGEPTSEEENELLKVNAWQLRDSPNSINILGVRATATEFGICSLSYMPRLDSSSRL